MRLVDKAQELLDIFSFVSATGQSGDASLAGGLSQTPPDSPAAGAALHYRACMLPLPRLVTLVLCAVLILAVNPGASPSTAAARATITASVSRHTVDVGTYAKFRGQVSGIRPGEKVKLQRKQGKRWATLASRLVGDDRTFSFRNRITRAGTNKFRVVGPGAVSAVMRVIAYRWVYLVDRDIIANDGFYYFEPRTIADHTYRKSVSVYQQASGVYEYAQFGLFAKCTDFVAVVGLDDDDSDAQGSAEFELSTDDVVRGQWQLGWGQASTVTIDVRGYSRIELGSTAQNVHDVMSTWGNARIRCRF